VDAAQDDLSPVTKEIDLNINLHDIPELHPGFEENKASKCEMI